MSQRAKKPHPTINLQLIQQPPTYQPPPPPSQQAISSRSTPEMAPNSLESPMSNSPSLRSKRRPKPLQLQSLSFSEEPKTASSVSTSSTQSSQSLPKEDDFSITSQLYKHTFSDEEFVTIEELGMGSGGTVYLSQHVPSQTIMAKKIIHAVFDSQLSKEILRELEFLKKCHADEIVSFFGAYQSQGGICICMEYMDVGSLEKLGKIFGPLEEPILFKVAQSVLKGLVYLYEKHRIIHRDIKPSNILINSHGKIKLCDFGVSGQVVDSLANTFVGTGAYMSPERIQGKNYATQSDTWSLGLTLYELAIAQYPLSTEDVLNFAPFELVQVIVNGTVPPLPSQNPNGDLFSASLQSFIQDCLAKNPDTRPTPAYLLKTHSFIIKNTKEMDMKDWLKKNKSKWSGEQEDDEGMKRWRGSMIQKRKSMAVKRESMLKNHAKITEGIDKLGL